MKMQEISKNNIFKVPEQYFDGLETNIQHRINSLREQKKPFFAYLKPKLALAISTVVLLALLFRPSYQQPDAADLLTQVSDDQLISYLAETEPIGAEDLLLDADISDSEFLEFNEIKSDTSF